MKTTRVFKLAYVEDTLSTGQIQEKIARKDCSEVVHAVYRTRLHRLYNTEQICIP